MLNTPILFLIFNRPEITARVFQEIRKAKPKQIYIAADGPRIDHPDDTALCNKTRQICDSIDWDCEVKTLFREENLGCQLAVSNAIDWFFKHESEGIILEDDCLPSQSFFHFCAELLDFYRDDEEIMCISGNNFQQGRGDDEESYYFSRYPHCWGWATWRRAWNKYDHDMSRWKEFREDHAKGLRSEMAVWQTLIEHEPSIDPARLESPCNSKLSPQPDHVMCFQHAFASIQAFQTRF